ncbi:MAG TPA: PCRF domain-containing protein, partial [Ignavibacteria bacterium]|nr:PCRF domain-containing protein [Ignavibacteria bacterium]
MKTLETQTQAADFWDDNKSAQALLQKISNLKKITEEYFSVENDYNDIITLIELAESEQAADMEEEINSGIAAFNKKLDDLEFRKMLSDSDDIRNAILTINSGAGGTESQDWAEMLLRMYLRYAEKKGFRANLIDRLDGDGAGIKSATVEIEGDYAYG